MGKTENEGVLSPDRGYGFSGGGGMRPNQDAHLQHAAAPSDPAKASLCCGSPSFSGAVSGMLQVPAADKPHGQRKINARVLNPNFFP